MKKYLFIGGCADGKLIKTNEEPLVNIPNIREPTIGTGERDSDIIEVEFHSYDIFKLQFTHKYDLGIHEKIFYISENISASKAIDMLVENYIKKG